jgi:hypothetical protein
MCCVIVSSMAHVPSTENEVQKVIRIAKVLDISIEDAAVTCDAFHLAFSDDGMRRAIFDVIDELDRSAAKKGEPFGLIINYTVELGLEGIRVGRYADEIPAGEIVELTPTHRANIFLKIVDNFPTQEFLGPLIVNRPELTSLAKEVWQTDVLCRADGVVCSDKARPSVETLPGPGGLTDTDSTRSEIPTELPSHWPKIAIPLGPIRLKFSERFPFISPASSSQLTGSRSLLGSAALMALKPPHHLPSGAVLLPPFQSTSGLSPPLCVGECGHSDSKDVTPALCTTCVETCVSHLDL